MYDVIVIGTGGIGSATLFELARRGVKVLGIDRFPPGHDRGSSHGQTRIIRRSYFEHADYVPLLNLAYELWDDLCETSGEQLFHRTGLIYVGDALNPVIEGVLRSAETHRLDVEQLNVQESGERFPGFVVPDGASVLYEADAGYLCVEAAVETAIAEAKRGSAQTIHDTEVVDWSATDKGVVVETTTGRYEAEKLIVTAGCWARTLLSELTIPLRIVRKHLHWFATADDRYDESAGCPCFFYALGDEYVYGFPDTKNCGLKVSLHSGGTEISDPLTDDRSPEQEPTRQIVDFLCEYLPGVTSTQLRHEVCFYTMTPDAHFVIDRHPNHANVLFAAGMSGHGFKFAPAIGRVLTELTLDGETLTEIGFLGLARFA